MKEAFLVRRCVPADVVVRHGQVLAQGRFEGVLCGDEFAEDGIPLIFLASRWLLERELPRAYACTW